MLLLFRRFLISSCYISILPISSCMLGCGPGIQAEKPIPSKPAYVHDAGLELLVESYVADAAEAGVPVPQVYSQELVRVVWSDDLGLNGNERVLGRCERFNENHPDPVQRFRTIHLLKPNAQGLVGSISIDEITLKTIVYHELGHCLHDYRGHLPKASHQIMSVGLMPERLKDFDKKLKMHFQLMKNKNQG